MLLQVEIVVRYIWVMAIYTKIAAYNAPVTSSKAAAKDFVFLKSASIV